MTSISFPGSVCQDARAPTTHGKKQARKSYKSLQEYVLVCITLTDTLSVTFKMSLVSTYRDLQFGLWLRTKMDGWDQDSGQSEYFLNEVVVTKLNGKMLEKDVKCPFFAPKSPEINFI